MIVDSSAIIAILRNEPDAGAMIEALQGASVRRISARSPTWKPLCSPTMTATRC
jgi:uncharacterized protein with PIN domain